MKDRVPPEYWEIQGNPRGNGGHRTRENNTRCTVGPPDACPSTSLFIKGEQSQTALGNQPRMGPPPNVEQISRRAPSVLAPKPSSVV